MIKLERARRLAACGVAAGPVFIGTVSVQEFTREGFVLERYPLSVLSLGNLGWIQVGNFIATGILIIASAAGMRGLLK